MYSKEFFEKVISANISKEMNDFALKELDKLARKNEKAKQARLSKAENDTPTMNAIVEYLTANGEILASVVADKVGISCPKAVALCKKLEDNGIITSRRVKVPKVGERTVYKVAETK